MKFSNELCKNPTQKVDISNTTTIDLSTYLIVCSMSKLTILWKACSSKDQKIMQITRNPNQSWILSHEENNMKNHKNKN
uniref:Uncharacterized protein n=1 Tax=Rhizophora mucronata TaxID=61149 RepID=A0A2P2LUM3_RHIMU